MDGIAERLDPCPSCGATLFMEWHDTRGFCRLCGANVTPPKPRNAAKGSRGATQRRRYFAPPSIDVTLAGRGRGGFEREPGIPEAGDGPEAA